jgi:hypothetical protein
MAAVDPCECLVDSVADRFEVLHQRYQMFLNEIPAKFQQWVRATPAQRRVFASLESVCADLFPDLLSMSADLPRRWIVSIACVALKHWVVFHGMQGVELSSCGRAIRVTGVGEAKAQDLGVSILKEALAAALFTASRSSALEVRLAQLESKSKGFLSNDAKRARWTTTLPENVVQAYALISEARAESLDALASLRKTHARMRREVTQLAAANEEISRLKEELESVKSGKCTTEETVAEFLVLPRRALSMAGFWNLQPNDLLAVTPVFIERVEARGGDVIRRKGMTTCFMSKDKDLFVQVAVEVMNEMLPEFKRAT